MIDPHDYELTDEEHEALVLISEHAIGAEPTPPLTPQELLLRLEQAYVCCKDCGLKYGVYSVGCSSTYMDTCQVCDEYKSVTETRDYAYLITGRHKLIALMEALQHLQ
jgi:hypothetical protein